MTQSIARRIILPVLCTIYTGILFYYLFTNKIPKSIQLEVTIVFSLLAFTWLYSFFTTHHILLVVSLVSLMIMQIGIIYYLLSHNIEIGLWLWIHFIEKNSILILMTFMEIKNTS